METTNPKIEAIVKQFHEWRYCPSNKCMAEICTSYMKLETTQYDREVAITKLKELGVPTFRWGTRLIRHNEILTPNGAMPVEILNKEEQC